MVNKIDSLQSSKWIIKSNKWKAVEFKWIGNDENIGLLALWCVLLSPLVSYWLLPLIIKQIVCNFIMTKTFSDAVTLSMKASKIQLEAMAISSESWTVPGQVWETQKASSLPLLLPPQEHNCLHHSKRFLDNHQKWSRSEFKEHKAQLYQHHPQSQEPSPLNYQWFSWAPLQNWHDSFKLMTFWDVHMVISETQWWVNVLGKAWNDGTLARCQFLFLCHPAQIFLDFLAGTRLLMYLKII